jgi:hypothetical protein
MAVESSLAEFRRRTVEFMDFPGMMQNVDPRDIPTGAAEDQINFCCILIGQLECRHGLREPNFEN